MRVRFAAVGGVVVAVRARCGTGDGRAFAAGAIRACRQAALQALLHRPQLFGSAPVLTSQPFDASWSQSAKPDAHCPIAQAPFESQAATAPGTTQGAQLVGLAQPLAGSPVFTQAPLQSF